MLQKISDRIQGWVAGIIVVIIAAVFSLWGIEYYIGRGSNDSKTVAKVNGEKITEKQLNTLYRQLQQRFTAAQPNRTLTVQLQKELKSFALQQLVTKSALVQAAKKAGFDVSLQEVQQVIMEAEQFQVKGMFSPQRFEQFLLAIQTTEAAFLADVRKNFIINQVKMGITSTSFVLPDELKQAYQLIYQKRNFGYFILPLSKFLAKVKVSEQEINDYYNKNKTAYKTEEKVQVQYLLLTPEEIEKDIKVTTAEMQSYYETNKSSYTTSRTWKVLRIMVPLSKGAGKNEIAKAEAQIKELQAQLKKGKSFKQLMSTKGLQSSNLSITPSTALAATANVLSVLNPGDVSQAFHTASGINLIKLISVTPPKTKSFAEVKTQIKKRLLQQKAQQILSQQSDELSNLTYTNPSSLKIASQKLGLKIQTSPWITKQGEKKGLFSKHNVVNTAFSSDVLQQGNNSNLIDLSNGAVMVLRVAKHQASKVQPLSAVKATIEKVIKKNKAESKAGLVAYEISDALAKGTRPQALAYHYGLTWNAKQAVQRNSKSVPEPIMISAFMTVPDSGKEHPGTNTLVLANGDYVVLKVSSAKLADPAKAPQKQLSALNVEMSQLNGKVIYQLYGKSVVSEAKIKIEKDKK